MKAFLLKNRTNDTLAIEFTNTKPNLWTWNAHKINASYAIIGTTRVLSEEEAVRIRNLLTGVVNYTPVLHSKKHRDTETNTFIISAKDSVDRMDHLLATYFSVLTPEVVTDNNTKELTIEELFPLQDFIEEPQSIEKPRPIRSLVKRAAEDAFHVNTNSVLVTATNAINVLANTTHPCATPEAIYTTEIDNCHVSVKVDLSATLLFLDEKEAILLERKMHVAMEAILADYYK